MNIKRFNPYFTSVCWGQKRESPPNAIIYNHCRTTTMWINTCLSAVPEPWR